MSSRAHTEEAFRLTAAAPLNTATASRKQPAAAERDASRIRHFLTVFDYRRYPVFTWDWSWRRCVLFGTFGCLYAASQGTGNGVMLRSWRIGFTLGLGAAELLLVAMCLAPLVGAWVRSRKWPAKREMTGVVAAVLLGVIAGNAFQRIGNAYANRVVLPQALETRVVTENYLARYRTIASSPLNVISNSVLFLLLSGGLALRPYFGEQRRLAEESREREVGELQLQKQETDLQLLVLQAQIEPHFLFNTLASLRSLLRHDVDRAEAMIDALVEHLRAAMPVFRERTQRSTLSDQLRLCCSYLELMRVRLPDRLTYAIDVPQGLRTAAFPPLILLTLVENAIKHGIEPKPGPGHIRIGARRERRGDGTYITVTVSDNGMGLSAGLGHGVGLSNIRTQLALKYGGRAALSLMSGAEGGAVASIDIPEADANEADIVE